jgi:hypothetical protein
MGSIFYLAGAVLAGFAGYSNYGWYFIFISSLMMAVGYFIIRAPQIHGIVSNGGPVAIPKLLIIQVAIFSIVTAPVYFITSLFN